MKILVLVGSTRTDSYNAAIADAAVAHLPETATVSRWTRLEELPYYSDALDTEEVHPVVADLRAAISEVDALLVATPEYNASLPGLLKNAVDWASRPYGVSSLQDKPVAVIGASPSPGGAIGAREDLVKIFVRAGAQPLERTAGVTTAHEGIVGGELVDAEEAAALESLVGELVASLRVGV